MDEIIKFHYAGNVYLLRVDPADGYRVWRIIDEGWHRLCTDDERIAVDRAYLEENGLGMTSGDTINVQS